MKSDAVRAKRFAGDIRGTVTAAHPKATEAGISILRQGGNAADAAIATALALGVVDPANSGLGGYGGFALARCEPVKSPLWLNFNTTAPLALPESTAEPGSAETVSVPGVLAGLEALWRRFGALPWAALFQPAVTLCNEGYILDRAHVETFKDAPIWNHSEATETFTVHRDERPQEGQRLRLLDYGRTLEQVAQHGGGALYRGEIGQHILSYLRGRGSALSSLDFQRYQATWRPPLQYYKQGSFAYLPGFGSGGPVIQRILMLLDELDLPEPLGSARAIDLAARSMAFAWSQRDRHISAEWARGLVKAIMSAQGPIQPSEALSPGHTTHLNAIDGAGNIVTMTLTHGPRWFGSGLVVPGTGIVLNCGLELLSQRDTNKQLHSNMAPALMESPSGRWTALGTPGGRRIPSLVALALHHLLQGDDTEKAIRLPRIHHDSGVELFLDPNLRSRFGTELTQRGWAVTELRKAHYFGPASAADFRAGCARGFVDQWFRGKAMAI